MPLSDIQEKLYKKEADAKLAEHEKSEFDPKNEESSSANIKFDANDKWEERKSMLGENEKKIIGKGFIWLGVVLGIIFFTVAFYQVRKASFNESKVAVNMQGPDSVQSGELVTYEIDYVNKNWASLENAVLQINHPESFKPENSDQYRKESPTISVVDLGTIEKNSSGKILFSGKAYSPKGTLIYIKTELTYKPANFNSNFKFRRQIGVNVTSTPIRLDIEAPSSLANGNALDYQITYKNEGEEAFENIRVQADLPDGFVFSRAYPGPSEGNNIWHIGRIGPGESGKIIISGTLEGERDTSKNLEVSLGVINQGQFVSYNNEKLSTKIVDSPLRIWQTVNDSDHFDNADPGESLKFKIHYRNESDLRLRDVIVKENLESLVLDFATLEMGGGAFDESTKTIEWKASDHPELALVTPGQSGYVEFSVNVRKIIPIKSAGDNNFMISSLARIDSPDIPTPIASNKIIPSNKKNIKLNSKLILVMEGFYNSPLIPNFGPLPPVVGQETSYTIHLKVGNLSNVVGGTKAEIILPTGVSMTGVKHPENADLNFNERTNSLVWNIGDMQVGEGIIGPYRETAFQIKIKPSPDQAGRSVPIVKSVVLSGKDSFTGEDLVFDEGGKTTALTEDSSLSAGSWSVAK